MNQLELTLENLNVLKAISEHGPILVPDLTKIVGLDRGKVEGCLASLVEQKLVHRTQKNVTERILTERGRAAKNGLAERQIIDVLADGSIPMAELAERTNLSKADLTAGIGILRKVGIISITKGNVSIADAKKASKFSINIQSALKQIAKNPTAKVTKGISDELLTRGFIEILENAETRVSTPIKESHLNDAITKEEVSRLTPKMLASGTWRNVTFKPYSLKTKPRRIYAGRYNPYRQFLDQLRIKLIGLGFQEMKGPLIEQEFWNFDALYAAQDHPAREDSDILLVKSPTHGKLNPKEYVKNVAKTHEDGWNTGSRGFRYKWDPMKAARLLLRPQGTSVSARTLATIDKPPAKFFSIARNFRPDQIDATHDVEFDQTEGIICDPSITFTDLLGMLKTFAVEVAGAKNVQFRPDYYPFTSPSVELSAEHPVLGHVEFGGSGMFRPEVTQPFGIDYPVLAWGIGVGRLFMTKYKITDIRELFTQNLEWLREERVSSGIQVDQ
ncbi:MAG: phenylalanine--tRNA ligase subunit alpha [Candidatus Kariarchaeaceae archaeon]|jgi:phenylalanyl-tRNA synthetase alpha chain